MAFAHDLHKFLFEAIEQRYAQDADLLQLAGPLYRDNVPAKDERGREPQYPLVRVVQGEEGNSTEEGLTGDGMEPVDESFAITFDVVASTQAQASQIAWQIVHAFRGWEGPYPGVEITCTRRPAPPWVGETEQGECAASVSIIVSASPVEE